MGDLSFAWKVCKHVRSNAIVLAGNVTTVGIGAGQMSRVDSVRIAVDKARLPIEGSALASDAFFPFADGPRSPPRPVSRRSSSPAARAATPRSSRPATRLPMAMVSTSRRHFRH